MRALADVAEAGDALGDLRIAHAERGADRRCRERRVDHVHAVGWNGRLKRACAMPDRATRAPDAKVFDVFGDEIVPRLHAVGQPPRRRVEAAQQRIVAIEHGQIVFAHRLKDLGLRAKHALPVAQEFQVRIGNGAQYGDVWAHHARQPGHLAEIADAHLDHGDLVRVVELEQRPRHAQLVVEVLLRLVNVEPRREHRREHLLRRRLADAAGHAHDGDVKPRAVPRGQRPDRAQRRVHAHAGLLVRPGIALGQAAGRARAQAVRHEVVAVGARAGKGHEQRARLHFAAVAGDKRNSSIERGRIAEVRPARRRDELAKGEVLHAILPFIANSTSRWQSDS